MRAKLKAADAVYIWTDKHSTDVAKSDKSESILILHSHWPVAALLQCLAIKAARYWVRTIVQVLAPENKSMFQELGPNIVAICYNELRMGVIAGSLVYPGFGTLMSSLMVTQRNQVPQNDFTLPYADYCMYLELCFLTSSLGSWIWS